MEVQIELLTHGTHLSTPPSSCCLLSSTSWPSRAHLPRYRHTLAVRRCPREIPLVPPLGRLYLMPERSAPQTLASLPQCAATIVGLGGARRWRHLAIVARPYLIRPRLHHFRHSLELSSTQMPPSSPQSTSPPPPKHLLHRRPTPIANPPIHGDERVRICLLLLAGLFPFARTSLPARNQRSTVGHLILAPACLWPLGPACHPLLLGGDV